MRSEKSLNGREELSRKCQHSAFKWPYLEKSLEGKCEADPRGERCREVVTIGHAAFTLIIAMMID